MFFGIEVKSGQNQAKYVTLENPVKLTQAVLEPTKNGKKEPVSLMVEHDKKSFILCVIDPALSWQCPLDLVFNPDSSLKFYIKGTGTIHLTGYEITDDLDDLSMSMSSLEDEDDDDDEEEDGVVSSDEEIQNGVEDNKVVSEEKGKKTLNTSATKSKSKTNGVRIPTKRTSKPTELNNDYEEDDDDDDESDDSDFDVSDIEDEDEDGIDDEDSLDIEDDDDDDDDDDLEDEDEDENDIEEAEDEEMDDDSDN